MKKKKIYLAGKVTGLSMVEASHKFGKVEKQLMNDGYEVVNPLNLMPVCQKEITWQRAMRICIKALMDCDEAYFMPCYVDSPGAMLELQLCIALKIPHTIETVNGKLKSQTHNP